MAQQNSIRSLSIPASGDLSASQFCFVQLSTSGQIQLPSAAGGDAIGVLQDKPNAAGIAGEVAMLNGSLKVKVISAGTITAGDKVQSDTAGKALTAASGDHVLGTALISAVAGDLIEILPGSRHLLA